ncbi:MAG: hypothetical protein KGL12_14960, partial [Rhodospirillales bacterium]|nr:hypothetical protein [Rhodospirillales bacterium]
AAEAGIRALDAVTEALRRAADAGRELAELRAGQLAAWLGEALAAALPALCARHGAAEMQAVIGAVLPALIGEPEIEIAVATDAQPAVVRALTGLDPRIAARVRVTPAEAMASGDLRIHWQDGMAMRDGAALCAAVLDILAPSGLASASLASSPRPGAARAMIRESVHVE